MHTLFQTLPTTTQQPDYTTTVMSTEV